MGIVLHGSCNPLSHGHSHGPKGLPHHHNHTHSHSHNNHNHSHNNTNHSSSNNRNNNPSIYLQTDMNGRTYTSLNHNSSRNPSRHNSFTKIGIKSDDDHRNSVDLLRVRIDEPLVHRMSIDGGLTR